MASNLWNIGGKILGAAGNYWAGERAADSRNSAAGRLWNQSSFQPYNIHSGIADTGFNGTSGTATLKPIYRNIADRFRGLGNNFLDQLRGGSYNQLRDDQLSLMRRLARPDETRDVADMQTMLFNKGLLGSTSGSLQMNSLFDAQSDADLKRQLSAIDLARAERESLFDLGGRAHNFDLTMQALPLQQLSMGAEFGNIQAGNNYRAGSDMYDAAVSEADGEAGFWGNLFDAGSDAMSLFGKASTANDVVNGLTTAGGGNPIAGAKALFDGIGTGSWADLAAGPSSFAGVSSLSAAPGTAAEFAAFGDAPFAMLSETGIGAAPSAAGAGGVGTGTALAGNTLAAAGVVALPMLMAAISKFGKGGAAESAKSGKLAQQLQRDAQADPSGRTAQATIDRLITNQLWPGEGNQWVISDLMKSGVVTLNTPSLYSQNSVVDVFAPANSVYNLNSQDRNSFANANIWAQSGGLNPQQADQFRNLTQKYHQAKEQADDGTNGSMVKMRARVDMQQAKTELDKMIAQIEQGRKTTARQTYNTLTSQGYRGDLSKLKKYLGIK